MQDLTGEPGKLSHRLGSSLTSSINMGGVTGRGGCSLSGDSCVCGNGSSFLTSGSGSMWTASGTQSSSLTSCSIFTATGEVGGGGVGIREGCCSSLISGATTGDNGGYSSLTGDDFGNGVGDAGEKCE